MKSVKIMVSGFVMIITGLILKSRGLAPDMIVAILCALGCIMFAIGGYTTTLYAAKECLKQNNEDN